MKKWTQKALDTKRKGAKNSWHKRKVLETRHCKLFALHSCLWGAHQLSQDWCSMICNHSVFAHCIERTHLPPEPQPRNAENTGKMERRHLRFSWVSPRGESSRAGTWLHAESVDSNENFEFIRRVFDNTIFPPPLQQKPNAFCFECLVATSPYPIPWVYKCSPACTCPMLPGAIFSCPNRLFLWQWSL